MSEDSLEVDTVPSAQAFMAFGVASAGGEACAPPACGDDMFSLSVEPAATRWLTSTVAEKAAVAKEEVAIATLGGENVATYEGRDEANADSLATVPV